jgi:hypothetical protein
VTESVLALSDNHSEHGRQLIKEMQQIEETFGGRDHYFGD